MDKKQLLAIAIGIILLGEAIYLLFINAPKQPLNDQEEQRELFTAIMRAKVISIESILTKDKELSNSLKSLGCSVTLISDDNLINCDNNVFINISDSTLLFDNKNFTANYKIIITDVFTKVKAANFTQELSIKTPYFIKPNSIIELEGSAYIINETITEVKAENLYVKNVTKNETAKVEDIEVIYYAFQIPFDKRYYISDQSYYYDVVYTNITLMEKPDFVKSTGDGYIIVNRNTSLDEIKAYYKDATVNDIKYKLYINNTKDKDEIENLKRVFNYTKGYYLKINSSIGIIEIPYETDKDIKKDDEINITINALTSADLIISKNISIS